jgi:hypothetical protein
MNTDNSSLSVISTGRLAFWREPSSDEMINYRIEGFKNRFGGGPFTVLGWTPFDSDGIMGHEAHWRVRSGQGEIRIPKTLLVVSSEPSSIWPSALSGI